MTDPLFGEDPEPTGPDTRTPEPLTVDAQVQGPVQVWEPPAKVSIREHSGGLFGGGNPAEIVAQATEVANALAGVIRAKHLYKTIGQKNHVLVEAWTLCGSMLGVFPVCVWTRKIEGGWESRVEARTLQGQVVGAAEASCMESERNWKGKDDYAIRSMAQTRATAKALRLPLGFIIVLAGYEATPSEEMPAERTPDRDMTQDLKESIEHAQEVKANGGERTIPKRYRPKENLREYAEGECDCGSALLRRISKKGNPFVTCALYWDAKYEKDENALMDLAAVDTEKPGVQHFYRQKGPKD